jgi:hypothetical protein
MKKTLFVSALLFAWTALSPAAQEGAGPVSTGLLDTEKYSEYFGFNGGNINIRSNYIWAASDTDIEKFGVLNFDASKMNREDTRILTDTPLEFVLLSVTIQPKISSEMVIIWL